MNGTMPDCRKLYKPKELFFCPIGDGNFGQKCQKTRAGLTSGLGKGPAVNVSLLIFI